MDQPILADNTKVLRTYRDTDGTHSEIITAKMAAQELGSRRDEKYYLLTPLTIEDVKRKQEAVFAAEVAESQRRQAARDAALSKLTDEEKRLLKLI